MQVQYDYLSHIQPKLAESEIEKLNLLPVPQQLFYAFNPVNVFYKGTIDGKLTDQISIQIQNRMEFMNCMMDLLVQGLIASNTANYDLNNWVESPITNIYQELSMFLSDEVRPTGLADPLREIHRLILKPHVSEKGYRVPEEKIEEILEDITNKDMRKLAEIAIQTHPWHVAMDKEIPEGGSTAAIKKIKDSFKQTYEGIKTPYTFYYHPDNAYYNQKGTSRYVDKTGFPIFPLVGLRRRTSKSGRSIRDKIILDTSNRLDVINYNRREGSLHNGTKKKFFEGGFEVYKRIGFEVYKQIIEKFQLYDDTHGLLLIFKDKKYKPGSNGDFNKNNLEKEISSISFDTPEGIAAMKYFLEVGQKEVYGVNVWECRKVNIKDERSKRPIHHVKYLFTFHKDFKNKLKKAADQSKKGSRLRNIVNFTNEEVRVLATTYLGRLYDEFFGEDEHLKYKSKKNEEVRNIIKRRKELSSSIDVLENIIDTVKLDSSTSFKKNEAGLFVIDNKTIDPIQFLQDKYG